MKELQIINKEVSPIIKEAQVLEITDHNSLEMATDFLSKLNKENDRLTADKESLTKPLNITLKGIRDKYKPALDILDTSIGLIRDKMSVYQTNLIQKRQKEEAKIADKVSKGKLKLDTAVRKLGELEPVDGKVEASNGSISFRTDLVLEIVSKKDIPIDYLTPNTTLLLTDLKAGKSIAGVKLVEKLTPINKRL